MQVSFLTPSLSSTTSLLPLLLLILLLLLLLLDLLLLQILLLLPARSGRRILLAQDRLRSLGYTSLRLYRGSLRGWKASGGALLFESKAESQVVQGETVRVGG